ncbi:MAG: hypothetical protein J3K34DRAFT_437690 [Monoraphidium minutum]|nr:MAG: hypothetical protein J3K34DRAFT_437690 [Monoraphidium minutum]
MTRRRATVVAPARRAAVAASRSAARLWWRSSRACERVRGSPPAQRRPPRSSHVVCAAAPRWIARLGTIQCRGRCRTTRRLSWAARPAAGHTLQRHFCVCLLLLLALWAHGGVGSVPLGLYPVAMQGGGCAPLCSCLARPAVAVGNTGCARAHGCARGTALTICFEGQAA